jgi:hypothetical protein
MHRGRTYFDAKSALSRGSWYGPSKQVDLVDRMLPKEVRIFVTPQSLQDRAVCLTHQQSVYDLTGKNVIAFGKGIALNPRRRRWLSLANIFALRKLRQRLNRIVNELHKNSGRH